MPNSSMLRFLFLLNLHLLTLSDSVLILVLVLPLLFSCTWHTRQSSGTLETILEERAREEKDHLFQSVGYHIDSDGHFQPDSDDDRPRYPWWGDDSD